VPEVLTITVKEDAAVVAHILRVPAAEVRIEERMWDTTQCLHRCLEAVPADIELDAALWRLLMRVHSRNLARKISAPRIDLRKGLHALLGHLG
jgi:hypothetical protein